jgi:hypothetical protein
LSGSMHLPIIIWGIHTHRDPLYYSTKAGYLLFLQWKRGGQEQGAIFMLPWSGLIYIGNVNQYDFCEVLCDMRCWIITCGYSWRALLADIMKSPSEL